MPIAHVITPSRLVTHSVCRQCKRQLLQSESISFRQLVGFRKQYATAAASTSRSPFETEFFRWSSRVKEPIAMKDDVSRKRVESTMAHLASSNTPRSNVAFEPKSQKVQRRRPSPRSAERRGNVPSEIVEADAIIPPDASSQLSTLSAQLPAQSFQRIFNSYLALSKPRLTFLIVLTTTAAYTMYPVPALLDPAAMAVPSLSPVTLLFLTTGTFLTSASANAFNMLMEPEYDAKMSRTRNRPLVRKLLTTRAAIVFAILTGAAGTFGLYFGVNPTTAFLALSNIALYAAVYTPLKRIHPINTWVGALVGAIPPLMGWTAAAGQCASESGDWHELLLGPDSRGGWALAGLLFLWQLPHFAALSWTIRHEYAAAGYRMLCSSKPRLDAWFSLICAAALQACTTELVLSEVIDSWAFLCMVPANGWITLKAWQFLRHQGMKSSARNLFWASVWYLPIVLVLGMVGKKGLSDRVLAWFTGNELELDDEEGEWEYAETAPEVDQKVAQ